RTHARPSYPGSCWSGPVSGELHLLGALSSGETGGTVLLPVLAAGEVRHRSIGSTGRAVPQGGYLARAGWPGHRWGSTGPDPGASAPASGWTPDTRPGCGRE